MVCSWLFPKDPCEQLLAFSFNSIHLYRRVFPLVRCALIKCTLIISYRYGLLGPSGCGKTTLLSCVVGVRKLDSGEIWVLGGKPGTKGSGVPGPRVGYMPQEISLVEEFSVIGALYFFGRINGLENEMIGRS